MTNARSSGALDVENPYAAPLPNYGDADRLDEGICRWAKPRRGAACKRASRSRLGFSAVAAALVALGAVPCVHATLSQPIEVTLNASESYLWHTAPAATFTLAWVDLGQTASLRVVGRDSDRTYADLSGGSFQLTLPAAGRDSEEDLYDLVLTLGDGTVKRAKVAVVRGTSVDGASAVATYRTTDSKRWARFPGTAVIPVPPGTETLTVDGESVDPGFDGDAGWYVLNKTVEGVTRTLELDGQSVEVVSHPVAGMVLIIR